MKMMRSRIKGFTPAILMLLLPVVLFARNTAKYDILILRGRVMDGTGNPWFVADLGIRDGKIAAVGRLEGICESQRILDAEGKMVVPGFIDIHSHGYDPVTDKASWREDDEARFSAPNFVSQGITTTVTGQCGYGPIDIDRQREALMDHGIGVNAALMVGHNNIRREVMGRDFQRTAGPEEIEKMKKFVRRAMEDGAVGLSTGLEYVPAIWSDTAELIALTREIAPFGGVFIVHERASGEEPMWYIPSRHEPGQPSALDYIVELIEVSERTGVTTVATHIKIRGANYWGAGRAAIRLIDDARARGVNIWADCYPYRTTGSDGSTRLIPTWALGGSGPQWQGVRQPLAGLKETLKDPQKTEAMRRDIKHEIARRGGAENIVVMDYPDSSLIGKSIAQIARVHGIDPVDAAVKLQIEGYSDRPGGARMRGYSLSEIDVEAFMRQPWCATCTDANICLPQDGPVHARHYGAFPRKIRHYVMDRGVITLEHAIRSMTSLPAQILGLRDRGMIREGFHADIVIFDPQTIRDTATQFDPHQYAEGIDYVLVNGTLVMDGGKRTGSLPGVVILKQR